MIPINTTTNNNIDNDNDNDNNNNKKKKKKNKFIKRYCDCSPIGIYNNCALQ